MTTAEGNTPTDLTKPAEQETSSVEVMITEAYQAPELAEINAQIDALLAQREDLMFELAAKKHPERAVEIKAAAKRYKDKKKKS